MVAQPTLLGLSFFSTKGGEYPPRIAGDPKPSVIVRSDPTGDAEKLIAQLRRQWPRVCRSIFAESDVSGTWDIRWFFDEYDFYHLGGRFLYEVILEIQRQNEDEVVRFSQNWTAHNHHVWPYIMHEQASDLSVFHKLDHAKYGAVFLRKALQHMRAAYERSKNDEMVHMEKVFVEQDLLDPIVTTGGNRRLSTCTSQPSAPAHVLNAAVTNGDAISETPSRILLNVESVSTQRNPRTVAFPPASRERTTSGLRGYERGRYRHEDGHLSNRMASSRQANFTPSRLVESQLSHSPHGLVSTQWNQHPPSLGPVFSIFNPGMQNLPLATAAGFGRLRQPSHDSTVLVDQEISAGTYPLRWTMQEPQEGSRHRLGLGSFELPDYRQSQEAIRMRGNCKNSVGRGRGRATFSSGYDHRPGISFTKNADARLWEEGQYRPDSHREGRGWVFHDRSMSVDRCAGRRHIPSLVETEKEKQDNESVNRQGRVIDRSLYAPLGTLSDHPSSTPPTTGKKLSVESCNNKFKESPDQNPDGESCEEYPEKSTGKHENTVIVHEYSAPRMKELEMITFQDTPVSLMVGPKFIGDDIETLFTLWVGNVPDASEKDIRDAIETIRAVRTVNLYCPRTTRESRVHPYAFVEFHSTSDARGVLMHGDIQCNGKPLHIEVPHFHFGGARLNEQIWAKGCELKRYPYIARDYGQSPGWSCPAQSHTILPRHSRNPEIYQQNENPRQKTITQTPMYSQQDARSGVSEISLEPETNSMISFPLLESGVDKAHTNAAQKKAAQVLLTESTAASMPTEVADTNLAFSTIPASTPTPLEQDLEGAAYPRVSFVTGMFMKHDTNHLFQLSQHPARSESKQPATLAACDSAVSLHVSITDADGQRRRPAQKADHASCTELVAVDGSQIEAYEKRIALPKILRSSIVMEPIGHTSTFPDLANDVLSSLPFRCKDNLHGVSTTAHPCLITADKKNAVDLRGADEEQKELLEHKQRHFHLAWSNCSDWETTNEPLRQIDSKEEIGKDLKALATEKTAPSVGSEVDSFISERLQGPVEDAQSTKNTNRLGKSKSSELLIDNIEKELPMNELHSFSSEQQCQREMINKITQDHQKTEALRSKGDEADVGRSDQQQEVASTPASAPASEDDSTAIPMLVLGHPEQNNLLAPVHGVEPIQSGSNPQGNIGAVWTRFKLQNWDVEYRTILSAADNATEPHKSEWTKEVESLKLQLLSIENQIETLNHKVVTGKKSVRSGARKKFNIALAYHHKLAEDITLLCGRIFRDADERTNKTKTNARRKTMHVTATSPNRLQQQVDVQMITSARGLASSSVSGSSTPSSSPPLHQTTPSKQKTAPICGNLSSFNGLQEAVLADVELPIRKTATDPKPTELIISAPKLQPVLLSNHAAGFLPREPETVVHARAAACVRLERSVTSDVTDCLNIRKAPQNEASGHSVAVESHEGESEFFTSVDQESPLKMDCARRSAAYNCRYFSPVRNGEANHEIIQNAEENQAWFNGCGTGNEESGERFAVSGVVLRQGGAVSARQKYEEACKDDIPTRKGGSLKENRLLHGVKEVAQTEAPILLANNSEVRGHSSPAITRPLSNPHDYSHLHTAINNENKEPVSPRDGNIAPVSRIPSYAEIAAARQAALDSATLKEQGKEMRRRLSAASNIASVGQVSQMGHGKLLTGHAGNAGKSQSRTRSADGSLATEEGEVGIDARIHGSKNPKKQENDPWRVGEEGIWGKRGLHSSS